MNADARGCSSGVPAEMSVRPALWLGGATASGKSSIALHLAARLDAEIVSVDSMQVYRGMDIGTAKPSAGERRRIPHHLLDVVEIDQEFSVAAFVREAVQAIASIRQRNRLPLLCGGTGLYFRALLNGIGSGPESEPELRRELESTPVADLLAELHRLEPQILMNLDTRNPRRVVRAVEILRLSGRAVAEQRAPWPEGPAESVPFFRIQRQREDLRDRIERRVDCLFAQGLVEETRGLLQRGLADNRAALQAIGYRQVVEHLRGDRGLAETVALVKQRTRTFARRQRNWFERQLPTEAIEVDADESPERTAERLCERLRVRDERRVPTVAVAP